MIKNTANLGTPVKVDIDIIERELNSLWKSTLEDNGENASMRACSCNLLSIVQDRPAAEALVPVLAKVAEWHPNRSIIAYLENANNVLKHGAVPPMQAWIGTQCSIPFSGGPQVCCETITVAAEGRAIPDLPNTLVALFIPDLPIYLYWSSPQIFDQELVEQMSRFSQLLIVDSHYSHDDPQNRLHLLELLIDSPSRIAVRDLNWSRLTPWRDLIAQFFDAPNSRHYLQEISQVEIIRSFSAPGSIPTRTLLLTGWLVSRLGWKRISTERQGAQWFSRWMGKNGEIIVQFTGNPAAAAEVAGISTVTLRARRGAEFSVGIEKGSSCFQSIASIQGSRLVHSVPQEPTDEASLLIRELSQSGEDIGFKEALAEALALEKSFLMA